MAKRNLSTLFKSLLLQFVGEADPLLSMLEWMTQQLMQVEAGAEKGKHSSSCYDAPCSFLEGVDDQGGGWLYTGFLDDPGLQEEDGRWPSAPLWYPSGDHD